MTIVRNRSTMCRQNSDIFNFKVDGIYSEDSFVP